MIIICPGRTREHLRIVRELELKPTPALSYILYSYSSGFSEVKRKIISEARIYIDQTDPLPGGAQEKGNILLEEREFFLFSHAALSAGSQRRNFIDAVGRAPKISRLAAAKTRHALTQCTPLC
jgi:hypothetical protein